MRPVELVFSNSKRLIIKCCAVRRMEGGFLNPKRILEEINVLKPGMQVADFGSGVGYFSLPLAHLVGERGNVYAIDVLELALSSVEARAKSEGIFTIHVRRADLEVPLSSGLPENSLDVVQ